MVGEEKSWYANTRGTCRSRIVVVVGLLLPLLTALNALAFHAGAAHMSLQHEVPFCGVVPDSSKLYAGRDLWSR